MGNNRSKTSDDGIIELLSLLHQFSAIGYRIYFSLSFRHTDISHNPLENFCSFFPQINSIIGCFKSYLVQVTKLQKVNYWVKNDGIEINQLLSKSPISWILFDALNYLIDQQNWDMLPILPHIERLIITLDSINIILPKTLTNESQEIQWSLFGFPGCPNTSNVVPEPGSSWMWLLDLQRLAGLVLGNLYKRELTPSILNESFDEKNSFSMWLETPLFNHIIELPVSQVNESKRFKSLSMSYDKFLGVMKYGNSVNYFAWSKHGFLYSLGLQIYTTIVHLFKSKYPQINFRNSIYVYRSMWKIMKVIMKHLTDCYGIQLPSDNYNLTAIQEKDLQNYIIILNAKCNFLMSFFKGLTEISESIQISETKSSLINALDLVSCNKISNKIYNSKISYIYGSNAEVSSVITNIYEIEILKFSNQIQDSLEQFLVIENLMNTNFENDLIECTNSYLQTFSSKIYFKKKSIDRISRILTSLYRLLDSSKLSIDTVIMQILNALLISHPCIKNQMYESHFKIMEKIFSKLLLKLNEYISDDIISIYSQRTCITFINFLSSYHFGLISLIEILIDQNFINSLLIITNNRLFISTEKWLIIEGTGDNNLPQVCNMIGWCILENFVLSLSINESIISQERMILVEKQLFQLVCKIYEKYFNQNDNHDKGFDLYYLIIAISHFYKNSSCFRKIYQSDCWIKVLLQISTNINHLVQKTNFHSKFSLNLIAMKLLFSILSYDANQENENGRNLSKITIKEIFQKFADFYHFLVTKSMKFDTMKFTDSISCKMNFYKHLCEDLNSLENNIKFDWNPGNCNFDKQKSYCCQFLSSDKVSITKSDSDINNFIVFNSEDLSNGIWHISFDTECVDNSVDFIYGFISSPNNDWPTDYVSMKKLLKRNSSMSISYRSSRPHRLSCVIDIDQSFLYFSNNNNRIQTFNSCDCNYRFFIASLKNYQSSFQIQMISVKQLCLSNSDSNVEFYNNLCICPDYYILLSDLYSGFNHLLTISSQTNLQDINLLLIEKSNSLNQFDLFFDKNISTSEISSILMFGLFIFNEFHEDQRFFRGEICIYSTVEKRKENICSGVILNFQFKSKVQLHGLNFVEQMTKSEDVICSIYSTASNKSILIPLTHVQKAYDNKIPKKSAFIRAIDSRQITTDYLMAFLTSFFNAIPTSYFDVEITNYEGMDWSIKLSERCKIEYHFIKYHYFRLVMEFMASPTIIDMYLNSDNEKYSKFLESFFVRISNLAIKACPIRKNMNICNFNGVTVKLLEGFYQLYSENDLSLVKKYAYLYMENYKSLDLKGFLSKNEKRTLLRTLKKQPIDKNLIESFTTKSKDNLQSQQESRAVTFSDRRRRVGDYVPPHTSFQNQTPAEEYDSSHSSLMEVDSSLSSDTVNESPLVEMNQRLMDEFVLRTVNKVKKTITCPICETSLKYQSQSLFLHLSNQHSLNCRKSFQHHASHCINSDGTLSNIDNSKCFCASITFNGYCVCDEYLKNKFTPKKLTYSNENLNDFINEGYLNNILIGWSGTLMSEYYNYQKISEFCLSDNIRPKLDQIKILGDHIRQEINYSTLTLNSNSFKIESHDDYLDRDIYFICQLNVAAIIMSLNRLEYAFLVISSRNLIVNLAKQIFQKNSSSDTITMTKRFFFNDYIFAMNIIRFFEGGRIELNSQNQQVSNSVKCVEFKDCDFLSVIILGLESSLDNHEKIHQFIVTYIQNLENFLSSHKDYFNLNTDFDTSVLIRPSTLIIQLLFNTTVKVLFTSNYISSDDHQFWQSEIEQIMELLAFGIINENTVSKVKIWCLQSLMQMFKLIQSNSLIKNPDRVNMVDLCEDLSIEDSPTIHLANCNATVKKLISVMNRHSILTADCEGTMRLWDIDSIIGTEQNLRQTFLFSLGDQILKNSFDRKSPEIMEKCLRMTEPLRTDLSNYLVQVGVQNIAVSSTGFYLAESLGIYLNIWSTRSIFSKPYVASFISLITSLIFPQQTFMGLHGCLVDLLLVSLADGELLLLRIFDNGTRVTQHQIPGLSDIQSNVTTAAWDEEKNLIAIGYNDGSIVLTDQIGNKIILETVHNNRILFLLYSPYVTQFEQYLLASSSVDETKVAIWKKDNLMCVLKLLSPITCLEWLSRKYIHEDKYHVIITGSSSGLIQFWQVDDSGDSIQNVITFCGHLCPISKLRICESTNLLASGCNNGWVNVWSLKDHSLISTCNGDGNVIGIEWTLQNNLVTAFSRSQYIKIWRYFNSNTLQKNGIRQWAYVRKIFLESTKTKSVKNLRNLKHFTLSIHKILNEQFLEEVESVKSGFSIVYSQYLQCLIQFAISLDFTPKFSACSYIEPIDVNNNYKSPCLLEIINDTYQHRGTLRHLLNLNGKDLPNHHLDWLFMIDEMVKLTQSVCFECKIPENIIPKWWWVWCIGSEELVHHYIESKWNNNHWSMKKQIELYQWYQNSPDSWIKEYSNSTFIWGCGIKGELGFLTKADWVKPTLASIDGIQQIVCGSGVTLLITCENKLMACGEGLEVIFNPFMREETFQIINVPVLNDYKIAHVSASRGPESHIIAITNFGEVFSWGIGSHGKLGHGHATTLKKPKSIETLRGKGAIMSDCGHMHSAVVTSSGELYTFGLGASGQLGVEILTGCDTPRLVNFGDAGVRIGFVSCGVNHTLALSTDGLKIFAFGDGACGKLGVGDVNDHFSPVLVNFHDKPLLKVACGQDFSVALTKNGNVYAWGHSDFIGISSSNSELDLVENHVFYPTHISSLNIVGVVIDICAGNNTTFALLSTGNLYGWGSNHNNLLRLGSKTHAYNPELILINKGLHLQQISCGRHHVAVSSHAPYSYRNNIPSGPQFKHSDIPEISSLNYPALDSSGFNLFDMTARLIFLLYWNEMIRLTWQFWIPQTNQHYDTSDYDIKHYNYSSKSLNDWPHINNRQLLFSQSNWNWKPFSNFQNNDIRQFINTEFISSTIYRYLNGSMINNRTYTSLVRIDRINKKEPVFIQTCRQVLNMDAASLRLPWRAWKVKLINEGADDAGGAYDETISEICNELENEDLFPRILIPVPSDSSTFVPNPDIEIPHQYFNFLGILMATAIRTKKPIDLHLDPIFWKRMTKSVITVDDLIRLDPSYFNSLLSMNEFAISGNENIEEIYGVDKFVCFSISKTESEVCYKGLEQRIEKGNISDFVRSCIYYRLHEFDNAIEHIRKSFCNFAPMVLLDVVNWKQLEKMVCGSQHISIDILKNIARYVDVDESDILFSWFWEILESFNESEKSLFLRFVTGKSRLPSQDSHIPFRLFIHISKQPVNSLPQSQTCFNQIRLPRYKSRTDMETCLRIAISQCRSIDMDDYMLIRNRENDI